MRIQIKNLVALTPENSKEKIQLLKILEKHFIFKNPKFNPKDKKSVEPRFYKLYDHRLNEKQESFYLIMKGSFFLLEKLFEQYLIEYNTEKIENLTTEGLDIKIESKFVPRDKQQQEAVEAYIKGKSFGMILAMCGFGKSFVAMDIITKLKKKTLIILDESGILEQWKKYLLDFTTITNINLGIVKGTKEYYKGAKVQIVLATKQTLINRPEIIKELNKEIGLLIIDEAHGVPADEFINLINQLSPKRILGLTATENRDDGKTPMLFYAIGMPIFKAERKTLIENGHLIIPELIPVFIKKQFFYKGRSYRQVLNKLLEDEKVAIQICKKIILKHYNVKNDSILLICKEKKYIDLYYNLLIKLGVKTKEIAKLSADNSKERKKIIKKTDDGKIKILITSTIFDKALSVNRLNVLVNLFPSREVANTIQRLGRISRSFTDKETGYIKNKAYCYDIIHFHRFFFNQFYDFNSNKNYRLTAHLEASNVNTVIIKELLSYGKKVHSLKNPNPRLMLNPNHFPKLYEQQNKYFLSCL